MWQTGWIESLLESSGIPITPWSIEVMDAWQASTPLEPWTNNPLGIPSDRTVYPAVSGTPYAMFPNMAAFNAVFDVQLNRADNVKLREALMRQDSYADAWRSIHALNWPGTKLEGEYPVEVLKLTSKSFIDSVTRGHGISDKTTGVVNSTGSVAQASNRVQDAARSRVSSILAATKALNNLMRRGE